MVSFILFVVIAVVYFLLDSRIKELEKKIKNQHGVDSTSMKYGEAGLAATDSSNLAAQNSQTSQYLQTSQVIPGQADDSQPPRKSSLDNFGTWLAKDWPLKVGALLILLSGVWLVTYAFMNNWIGPVGRISLGLIAGVITMVGAEYWQRKSVAQASILYVLGTSLVMASVYAARAMYDMFGSEVALVMMACAVMFMAVSSVIHKTQARAILSLVAAAVLPFLTAADSSSPLGLLPYAAVLGGGYAWVIWFRQWRPLMTVLILVLSFFSVFAVGDLSASRWSSRNMIVISYMMFFSMLMLFMSVASVLKSRSIDFWHLVSAIATGMFSLLWVMSAVPEHYQSLSLVAMSLVFLAMASFFFSIMRRRAPVIIYSSITLIFMGAAASIELDGPTQTLAMILLASVANLGLGWLSERRYAKAVAFVFAIPMMMAFESLGSREWSEGISWGDASVLAVLSAAFFTVWYALRTFMFRDTPWLEQRWISVYPIFGLVYAMSLVWKLADAGLGESAGVLLSMMVFTVIGVSLYWTGRMNAMKITRMTGIGVLVFVMARLFIVDVWSLAMGWRIVTFAGVGGMLVALALAERQKELR